jgi:hypothetical protein
MVPAPSAVIVLGNACAASDADGQAIKNAVEFVVVVKKVLLVLEKLS